MAEYQYYTVPEGTKTMELTKEFMKERAVKHQMQCAFVKSFGAHAMFVRSDGRLVGIIFKTIRKPPEGWRHYAKDELTTYRPDKRTPRGKELLQGMAGMTVPDSYEFTTRVLKGDRVMTGETGPNGGFYFAHATCERFKTASGDEVVLIGIPLAKNGKPGFKAPKDIIAIKTSEYHRFKEEHDALSKQPKAALRKSKRG